jgi:hypothetical protein
MPKNSSILNSITQFLVVSDGNPIFSHDLGAESNQNSNHDHLPGFVSAIEAFASSFYDEKDNQSSVGFGNRTIIINKDSIK